MNKTVAVALSGGLDSAVAATLLKRENERVIGVHFTTGYECLPGGGPRPASRAQQIADQIGISLHILDFEQAFKKEVIQHFVDAYRSGQTPNPCMVCNRRIKFGLVLEHVLALGASALATGHYARIDQGPHGQHFLLKGVDLTKDQSYFLARLTQRQLTHAMFPLGTYTKEWVRKTARELGFASFARHESQELCFISDAGYQDFLVNTGGLRQAPGPIVNTAGEIVGHHKGLHAYTIGQRRGIGIPGPEPYYVLRLDRRRNRLVIGPKSELAGTECTVVGIQWIGMPPPETPLSVRTRIRYRHKEAPSTVTPLGPDSANVSFSETQYAITPGQGAVFYEGERVLGGGWIAP